MSKQWVATLLGLVLVLGMVAGTGLLTQATAQVVVEPGWRYADGYWNYWDADDKSWYYTDGRHWYGYGDNGWSVYKFDKNFGKKVYREGYAVPGADITVPNHKIKIKVK